MGVPPQIPPPEGSFVQALKRDYVAQKFLVASLTGHRITEAHLVPDGPSDKIVLQLDDGRRIEVVPSEWLSVEEAPTPWRE
jgi:hypothetical protein